MKLRSRSVWPGLALSLGGEQFMPARNTVRNLWLIQSRSVTFLKHLHHISARNSGDRGYGWHNGTTYFISIVKLRHGVQTIGGFGYANTRAQFRDGHVWRN